MDNKTALVLLSGGLDSVVSLAEINKRYKIVLALTFDYGQKAIASELEASQKICEYYQIEHKVIKLDFLKEITGTINAPKVDVQSLNDESLTKKSAKAVWIANRNALFTNIAACFAEKQEIDYIILGANAEEAKTFIDNSKEFISAINTSLTYSTMTKPQVITPLIALTKADILKKGIELHVPFEWIKSCYNSGDKNCGECESCARLKRAIINTDNKHLLKILF